MKKDIVYTIRMNSSVRDALKRAAEKDRRSVASLLDKIITDYLEREGFSAENGNLAIEERRRHPRKRITIPGLTYIDGVEQAALPAVVLDLSMGGVLITYPKGSKFAFSSIGELPTFKLNFQLPRSADPISLDCDARRISDTGGEIHVGATFKEPDVPSLERLRSYLM